MKIGILTFPNSPSFGASLQMYGLYHVLQKMGNDVEIINYQNTFMAQQKHIRHRKNNLLMKTAMAVLDIPHRRKFAAFEKKMRFFPQKSLSEYDDLSQAEARYDVLICGSDQVWNPLITGEDLNYFFAFCEKHTKKVSYAASFGINELTGDFAVKVKEQLENFHQISVREEQGAKIVTQLVAKDCTIVLDPTMLVPAQEWRSHQKKVRGLPPKYIARFVFNHDEETEAQIRNLASKTKLPVVNIGGTVISKLKKGIYTGPIGPSEWLYVLDHAEYVVTDSFHGAAFSIIFQKNLLVSLASSTKSRLQNLLHTFELDHITIGAGTAGCEVDYRVVQSIMKEKREHSVKFLQKAISTGD